ncbi:hypothetical protein ABPG72_002200 [Tetrahymena utriculariae]
MKIQFSLLVALLTISSCLCWIKIAPNTTFQYQLQGNVNTTVNATVFVIDLFDNIQNGMIKQLKKQGKVVFCYFSAGSWEDWRADASQFPPSIIASNYSGWAGENWLNIRNFNSTGLGDIMKNRINLAAQSGCDGVDPDNVNVFENNDDAKLNITSQEQFEYNTFLANYAHSQNLAIALKNCISLSDQLHTFFDVAVNESCNQYDECGYLDNFIQEKKAAFGITYYDQTPAKQRNWPKLCAAQKSKSYSWIIKKLSLESWVIIC